MNAKKRTIALAALLALGVMAAACTDGNKLKDEVQQSLGKQAEMKSYSFAGTAVLDLGTNPAQASANPVAASLSGMFTNGKLEWSGVAATAPVRMDIDLKATPSGSSAAIDMPMMFKDNKLFLHIPLLNKNDEYFSVDLAELTAMSKQSNTVSPESFKQITKLSSDVAALALIDIQSKWFKKAENVTLQDGSQATVIKLDITDKNKQEISEAVKAKLPEIIDALKAGGVLRPEQADKMKQSGAASFALDAPGMLSVTIDGSGFIREQRLHAQYTVAGVDSKKQIRKIDWSQTYNDINQPPKFAKEEPKQVRSLIDILKLLAPKK